MANPVRLKRGVKLLYSQLNLPVLPTAVNSGLCWAGGATARAGTVVVSYLSALAPGLPSADFLRGTENAIDRELDRWRKAEPADATASV